MARINIDINGKIETIDVDPEMKLLWTIRDILGLTGTKFSCGMGICGACTVHIDGKPVRSCSTKVKSVNGKKIVTIEGLATDLSLPVIQSWLDEEVSQCGYCQSGQIMNASYLLKENSKPTDTNIDRTMSRVLCRCGTYQRIRKAIHSAAEKM